ncbi:uracil-DNA glycosylase [Donghicola mangrovi]|uniref:Type-4 uracil-DNA glycosylase n=1 Tax=Donghicola mangrovi TaxID=2729614 RepID=A0A850Q637_9RHOB|nr:uracil-DNA glycosylase [Donghicola mangrovi]NVO21869.1 uracil-DNA glycosylase [Donghicola mangrovi]
MEEHWDSHAALAALAWQLEAGVTDAVCDDPIDRFAAAEEAAAAPERPQITGLPPKPAAPPPRLPEKDPVVEASAAAGGCADLGALRAAMEAFDLCDLKRGAKQLVFADGTPGARVMILGEAPGRDEDREGLPFVGRAGQLLDRMLAAIGLDRRATGADGVYITNVLPWRPPQNRDPLPQEIAMMMPFVQRHVQLAKPDVIVLMGNISCQAALGKRGITRLRGEFTQAFDRPALPMFHPAFLLRNPAAKREAWADLLTLRAHLNERAKP